MISHNTCLSLFDLFYLVWSSQGLSSCYKWQCFILFHGWAIFHRVWIHSIFFISSPVDGHLDCFRVLAVVSSAAMNTGVYVSFLKIFTYFWLCWVLVAVHDIFTEACGFLSSCGAQVPERVAAVVGGRQASLSHGMWDLSSPTRDGTWVSCIGRWILIHGTTGDIPEVYVAF